MSERWPCPCCGHLTLPQGPGDYGLCPVCFWEDDGYQLRWPLSDDGANGISLYDAQATVARHGAVDRMFRKKVRKPRADEPLDPGWRRFDPAFDWADRRLQEDRWPMNPEALYYWRPTYWNGDPDRMPSDRTPTAADRLVEHIRERVPELRDEIEKAEWKWGRASAMRLGDRAAVLIADAYRAGDHATALRIVTAFETALDKTSDMYVPNAVAIGFHDHDAWDPSEVEPFVEAWPPLMRVEFHDSRARAARAAADQDDDADAWTELWTTAKELPLEELEVRVRDIARPHSHLVAAFDHVMPEYELHVALTARAMKDPNWLRHHPIDSVRVAWRHRRARSPFRTLLWLRRPRFAG